MSNSHELAQGTGTGHADVDPDEEPSAEWGWHGGFPKGMLVAGWFSVLALLSLLVGNHEGRTEDLWLVGAAVVMAAGLILHSVRKRNAWRR